MNESTTVGSLDKSSSAATSDNGKLDALKARRKSTAGRVSAPLPAADYEWDHARQLLVAVLAFRDGDFSVRLPANWKGTEALIAEAFNQTLAHEERIAQEVARLSITV